MSTAEKLYDEAIELQQAGKLEEAVSSLKALVAAHPDYALAYCALSMFSSKLALHEEAIEAARKLCELEPDDPFNYLHMSVIYQKAGRIAEAENAKAESEHKQWAARQ